MGTRCTSEPGHRQVRQEDKDLTNARPQLTADHRLLSLCGVLQTSHSPRPLPPVVSSLKRPVPGFLCACESAGRGLGSAPPPSLRAPCPADTVECREVSL